MPRRTTGPEAWAARVPVHRRVRAGQEGLVDKARPPCQRARRFYEAKPLALAPSSPPGPRPKPPATQPTHAQVRRAAAGACASIRAPCRPAGRSATQPRAAAYQRPWRAAPALDPGSRRRTAAAHTAAAPPANGASPSAPRPLPGAPMPGKLDKETEEGKPRCQVSLGGALSHTRGAHARRRQCPRCPPPPPLAGRGREERQAVPPAVQ